MSVLGALHTSCPPVLYLPVLCSGALRTALPRGWIDCFAPKVGTGHMLWSTGPRPGRLDASGQVLGGSSLNSGHRKLEGCHLLI